MARGVKKAIRIGSLGKAPERRYPAAGAAIANISLATAESWKDKESGEKQERTEWHRVVFFGRLAEIVGEYLRKGSQVYVEGRLQTRKWQDKKDGTDRYSTEIVARERRMRGGRSGGFVNFDSPPPAQKEAGTPGAEPASAPENDFDDDIPF